MREQRKLFRVTIAREGVVRRGAECAPCALTELTPDGVGLATNLPAAVGETLQVEFCLTGPDPIQGTIMVTHRKGLTLGGRLVALAPEARRLLDRFLDEHGVVSLFAC